MSRPAVISHYLTQFSDGWYMMKIFIERMVGFSHDALHVVIGAALQLLMAMILRGSVRHFRPWLTVLAFALLNEWVDYFQNGGGLDQIEKLGESAKDIVLTMAVPTFVMLAARWRPQIFR